MALSVKPYKGARDFYPEDKRLQKYMFSTWSRVVESFGYEEYDAPILEPLDIYLAKTGSEIVDEQTYSFTDRGKRDVVIRPEMTPSVSRMVAARRQELSYPLRLYSIPNLWRYERPQRGRLREHWQLNVDIFGVSSENAELELITLADAIFKAFGAKEDMYGIRVNHRGLVNQILNVYLSLNEDLAYAVGKLIDRKSKLSDSDFLSQLDEILTDKEKKDGVPEKLLAVLSAKQLKDLPEAVKKHESYKELERLLSDLTLSNVAYDPTVMRGFDYYTGIVFEIFDKDPDNNRAMMGGGRYDGLVGLFGVEPVPTVGFGWGDVTLINFLEAHHLLPDLKPETDAYVSLIGDVYALAQKQINTLRQAGLNLAVDFSGRRLGDQLKAAGKKNIRYALIIGEDEIKSGKYKVKDLKEGKEKELDLKDLVKTIKDDSN
jgi:histidyl-tRNA synthetase